MNKILVKLESLNVKPKDHDLYFRAFTHSTFTNENKGSISYERLEFLGDSILSKLTAEYIYKNYLADEGKMSLLKIEAIKGTTLSEFSLKEGFDRLIRVGKTKERINTNKKILEDVFESFIGALFLDKGEKEVKKFLSKNVFKHIDENFNQELKNPKTILQEFLQGESRGLIKYKTITLGNEFSADVIWEGHILGSGKGANKKAAEVAAANSALKKVGHE